MAILYHALEKCGSHLFTMSEGLLSYLEPSCGSNLSSLILLENLKWTINLQPFPSLRQNHPRHFLVVEVSEAYLLERHSLIWF